MLKKRSYYLLFIIVSTLFIGTIGNIYVNAQTNLSAGDLVVITTNTDNPDLFEFISRIDIETGTTIYFSDNAWSGDNTRRTTEGTIRYIAPGFIAAGTKLYFENGFETTYPTIWEMNGGFDISTAGDNILVYQGSAYNDPAPNFLYGIGFAGLSTWISSGGPTANNSYLPAGLSIGTTAFSYNYDNIQYGCSSLGILSSDFLSVVSDSANRGGSNTIRYATTACTFDATKPQVSIDLASGQDDPTSATTVKFLVTFSEAINTSTFDCSDVNLIGTAGTKTCTNISEIAPNDGTTFEVTATATDNGTIIAEIEADKLADINGNPNDMFSAVDNSIVIDQTPPIITILNPNTDPALSKTISASTNEGTLTQSVNAVGDTTCDNSLTFNAYSATTFNTEADNGKYICYKAIDTAGNITYELSNAIGGIDYTSPNISFISDVELGPIQSDTVSINRDDATVKKWMYDNDGLCSIAIGDYANDYTVSIVENTETNNGDYICFYGEDSLGNKTTLGTTNTINIDVTNPTYGGFVDGNYYNITVNPTYSDANSVSATLNGSAFNSGDPVSADGVYSLVITDVAGNSTTVGFTIDKTNPSYGGFINGNYYNVTINPTYSDASSVSATLNGSAFNSGDPVSADGVYSLVITDVAGNSTTAGFTIDTTDPTYVGVVDGVYYNSDVTITYSDTNLNTATLNGSSYVSGTPISADNSYVFYVEDLAGNSETVNFIIDQSPPTATVAYAPNSLTNTDVLSTMTSSEPVTIDSAGGNTHNFALNGTHLFEFHDVAGNTGESLATVTWIDKVPPTWTINDTTEVGPIQIDTINITASDPNLNGSSLVYGFSIDNICDVTDTYTTLFTNSTDFNITGDHTDYLCVRGSDSVGNISYQLIGQLNIDNTTPIISFTDNVDIGPVQSDTILATRGDATIRKREYDTDGNCSTIIGDYTNNYTTDLIENTATNNGNYICLYAEDSIGNSITLASSTVIYIDITKPTATIVYSPGTLTNTNVLASLIGESESITIDSAGGNTHNFALNGTHLFEFHDVAGNTGESLATVTWIDKVPPELTGSTTITSSNSNTSFAKVGDVITITFTVNENLIANPTVSIVGGGVMNFASKIGDTYSYNRNMTSGDPSGIVSISIAMEDLATNVNSETEISTITFDKTAPAGISITTPTTEQRLKGSNGVDPDITFAVLWSLGTEANYGPNPIELQYSSLGNFSDIYVISGATPNDGSYNWTIPVGYNTDTARLRIIATDLAGNSTTFLGNSFNIDSIRPTEVIITTPSGLEYLKGNDEYDILYNGGLESNILTKTYALYIAGTFNRNLTVSPLNKRTVPSDLNNQSMLIRITVTDRAGWSNDGDSLLFTIDNTKPVLNFVNNSARRNTTVVGNTTVSDNFALWLTGVAVYKSNTFENSCNGGVLTIPSYTTDGTYNSYACVADRAGNVTTGSQTYNIDKTNPFVNAGTDKITNGVIFQDTTVYDILSGGAMSNISSQARSKISGPGIISFNPTNTGDTDITANTDGLYVLRLTAYDNAGNSSSDDINFTWDTVSPIIVGGSVVNINTSNPGYSFTSNETGTITYNGLCANGNISNVTIGTNSFSYSSRGEATYDNCQLVITDLAGNQTTHNVPTFTVDIPSGGGGGGGGGGGYISTCVKNDLVCIDGEYEKKSGVSCRGGDLGKTCGSDVCVDGDYSGNPNDGMCYDLTKVEVKTNTGEMETIITVHDEDQDTITGEWVNFKSPFNEELTNAYSYALNIKITTIPDIKNANMTGVLIRAHLSKMMSQYALKVLGKKPDTSRICIFNDMSDQSKEMQEYAVLSCQLGLMGLKTNGEPAVSFNPNDEVNRAIFGTTLSRAIRGDDYNEGTNWYEQHLQALNKKGIMNSLQYPMNLELRGYVMLMMMRADQGTIKSSYTNFESLRGKKIFVEEKKPVVVDTDDGEFNETDLEFINSANKNYQLYEGYTAGASNVGIKYLQYFLKNSKYYTGTINGVNNLATIDGLLGFQLDKAIINDENNPAAGYLGPTTRNIINPLLKELLN